MRVRRPLVRNTARENDFGRLFDFELRAFYGVGEIRFEKGQGRIADAVAGTRAAGRGRGFPQGRKKVFEQSDPRAIVWASARPGLRRPGRQARIARPRHRTDDLLEFDPLRRPADVVGDPLSVVAQPVAGIDAGGRDQSLQTLFDVGSREGARKPPAPGS